MYPPRDDFRQADWLITNRGIAKRAVFETRQDVERFCEAIAKVIAEGLVEVHAFVFLTTHFHLLVRSLSGDISLTMKLVTNEFVRWFNRSRKRDGSLFARRFHGRRIDDAAHWEAALRYIDLNPVRAGMCAVPSDHPYGSASAYRFGTGPSWLTRERVSAIVAGAFAPSPYSPELYDRYACSADPSANAYVIERLARDPRRAAPPLTDLIRTASLRQQGWMEWKAALADGMRVGTAFLPPQETTRAARVVARLLGREGPPFRRATLERDLAAGLLRSAAGRTITEIGEDLHVARSTARAALRRHDGWMNTSPRYSSVVARALQSAVRRALPPPAHPFELPRLVGM
jgi:REP element-mobilizing transposase RayT